MWSEIKNIEYRRELSWGLAGFTRCPRTQYFAWCLCSTYTSHSKYSLYTSQLSNLHICYISHAHMHCSLPTVQIFYMYNVHCPLPTTYICNILHSSPINIFAINFTLYMFATYVLYTVHCTPSTTHICYVYTPPREETKHFYSMRRKRAFLVRKKKWLGLISAGP